MSRKLFPMLWLLLLLGCKSKQTAVQLPPEPPRPEWVQNRPILPGYYVGIGVARKTGSSFDHIEQAKRNALNDMVSQIKVNVQANSIQSQLERNRVFSDEFRSFTRLTTDLKIENFEVVADWQNDREYWVYYRLSVADYQEQKNRQITAATQLALDLFDKAQLALAQQEYASAFIGHIRALEAIKAYLNEPLPVMRQGRQQFLGNEILTELNRMVSQLAIRVSPVQLKGKIGQEVQEELLVSVFYPRDKGKGIRNFPLRCSFSQGSGQLLGHTQTDDQGNCRIRIANISGKELIQEILIAPDFEAILQNQANAQLWMKAIEPQAIPSQRVQIQVARPLVWLSAQELGLDNQKAGSRLEDVIKSRLIAEGFQFTSDQAAADFKLELSASARQGTVNSGMYNAQLELSLRLTDAKQQERFVQKLSGIRGVQLDFNKAVDAAYRKAATDLELELLPRMLKIMYNL
jgi:hypothetical protein